MPEVAISEGIAKLLKRSKNPKSISFRLLGIIALAFIFGIVAVLLYQNATKSEIMNFSTVSLVSFLFSIALAGASIVLAITAISLGKASEQAMIERSDMSIKLQNEVLIKTMDALQRIESSTGVTEKRIEDMISGRASIISEKVVERILEDKVIGKIDRKGLEDKFKKSIQDEFSERQREEDRIEEKKKTIERKKALEKYKKFNNDLLLKIASNSGIRAEKLGQGTYGETGVDLVDGIFVLNDIKFAVVTHSDDLGALGLKSDEFPDFVRDLVREMSRGMFERIFFVIEGEQSEDNIFKTIIQEEKKMIRQEFVDNLYVFTGTIDEINQQIIKSLEKKGSDA